jgi:3'(2'), 5'-bisphosphate nucleotidase
MRENFLAIAVTSAINAGRQISRIYNDPDKDLSIEKKSDNTPLTVADKESHDIIKQHLQRTGLPILSEEGRDIRFEERRNWESFWLVDPLDGTKEFIKRNGEFTVNIALITGGKPVMGVIFVPETKILYAAVKGKGAWKMENPDCDISFSEIINKGIKLPLSPLPDIFTILESRSHRNNMTEYYINKLKGKYGTVNTIIMGSSLKLCMIAEGTAHLYPRFGPTMEWDTAAGHAIANAAGKKLLLTDNSGELVYNKEILRNPDFIAGDGII